MMAGDWLKFEKSTSDKPEVWAIADRLEIDPDAVVGKLLRVWAWFDEQSEKGNAPTVTKLLLDRRVGVTGFCDAMVECGWMHDDGKEVSLPNFDRHNGKTAKERSLTAKRQQKHREKSNGGSNGLGVTNALPREEKRREDSNTQDNVPPKGGTDDYPPEFEEAWKQKARREGGNSKKAAYKQWKARIRAGATVEDLTKGMERYRKYCEAKGIIGTDKVKMMATFWGPDEHYLEDYAISSSAMPDPTSNAPSSAEMEELKRTLRQYS